MSSSLCFTIGGLNIGIERESESFLPNLIKAFDGFLREEAPDFRLRIIVVAESDLPLLKEAQFTGELFRLDPSGIPKEPCMTLYTVDNQRVFARALRVVVSRFLALREGALFHAAGVVADRRGFLFTGPSGAGKSTIARKSAESSKTVLGDELIAIRRVNGVPLLYGTPFFSDSSLTHLPDSHSLDRVIFPVQSSRVGSTRVNAVTGALRLLQRVLCFDEEPGDAQRNLDFTKRIADSVTCFELEFTLKDDFWPELLGI